MIISNFRKYQSPTKSTDLDYLINPPYRNLNRLFAPSLKNATDDSARYSLHQYYMALVEIKDFNVLINNKWFFLISHKKRNNNRIIKEVYEKLIKMPRNNDYITYT